MKKFKAFLAKFKNLINKIKQNKTFQTYKEEMIAIPTLLFLFYLLNNLFIIMFPNGAFFDYVSQIETIIFKSVLFVIAMSAAHLALRISFPKIYKFLNEEIYHKFNEIEKNTARNYAVGFILVFIIASALIFG